MRLLLAELREAQSSDKKLMDSMIAESSNLEKNRRTNHVDSEIRAIKTLVCMTLYYVLVATNNYPSFFEMFTVIIGVGLFLSLEYSSLKKVVLEKWGIETIT